MMRHPSRTAEMLEFPPGKFRKMWRDTQCSYEDGDQCTGRNATREHGHTDLGIGIERIGLYNGNFTNL